MIKISGIIFLLLAGTAALTAVNPLHDLAKQGKCSQIAFLIKHHNADPDGQDQDGNTPLHAAVESGNPGTVAFFLSTLPRLYHIPIRTDIKNNAGKPARERAEELCKTAQNQEAYQAILKLFAEAAYNRQHRRSQSNQIPSLFSHHVRVHSGNFVRVVPLESISSQILPAPIVAPSETREDDNIPCCRCCCVTSICGVAVFAALLIWLLVDQT